MAGIKVSLPFTDELYQVRFLERPNKFLLRCVWDDPRIPELKNQAIETHLPDPGRLKELLIHGCPIWVRQATGVKRKTQWSTVLCQVPDGRGFVSLDTTLPNRLVGKALKEEALSELDGWSLHQAEFTHGNSRWDFLLTNRKGQRLFLEVKSVSLVVDKVGLFPDAVTTRGKKHLRELAELAGEKDTQAALLFLAQREDVDLIRPAAEIDPQFAVELDRAKKSGVKILGRKCILRLTGITLGEQVLVQTY